MDVDGLVNRPRMCQESQQIFTWWDYRNGSFHRNWGLRIDLLFVDPELRAITTATYVDREARKGEKPSDHVPVVADFAL